MAGRHFNSPACRDPAVGGAEGIPPLYAGRAQTTTGETRRPGAAMMQRTRTAELGPQKEAGQTSRENSLPKIENKNMCSPLPSAERVGGTRLREEAGCQPPYPRRTKRVGCTCSLVRLCGSPGRSRCEPWGRVAGMLHGNSSAVRVEAKEVLPPRSPYRVREGDSPKVLPYAARRGFRQRGDPEVSYFYSVDSCLVVSYFMIFFFVCMLLLYLPLLDCIGRAWCAIAGRRSAQSRPLFAPSVHRIEFSCRGRDSLVHPLLAEGRRILRC
ncbi:uncharacterized protein Tco025E_09911 [Trypanosoma conorhini]|uniref:Uncharacterized protein n=1 Tax=Trypanosoma conorhini TaxID=83891 RepID=A0A3R7KJN2_9TRYP|nr:uncharacterized protein Tco025E_09911 [Trypanosoma conorhini]RNE95802.1 hypothetical protein Tco025E_09911 [Trypanosoma conorhini]